MQFVVKFGAETEEKILRSLFHKNNMTDADDIMLMDSEVMDSTDSSFQATFIDQDSLRHAYRTHD